MPGTQRYQISDFGFRISDFLRPGLRLERGSGSQIGKSKLITQNSKLGGWSHSNE